MKIVKPQPDTEEVLDVVGLDNLTINYREGGLYIVGNLSEEGKSIHDSNIDIQLDFHEIELLKKLFEAGIL